ncbi:unnamed protein product, partial [Phaeothamnion confervicola]
MVQRSRRRCCAASTNVSSWRLATRRMIQSRVRVRDRWFMRASWRCCASWAWGLCQQYRCLSLASEKAGRNKMATASPPDERARQNGRCLMRANLQRQGGAARCAVGKGRKWLTQSPWAMRVAMARQGEEGQKAKRCFDAFSRQVRNRWIVAWPASGRLVSSRRGGFSRRFLTPQDANRTTYLIV